MVAIPVITSNGAELPAAFELVSVEVVREASRVPFARLLFADGDIPTSSYPALDSDALAPGAEIDIRVREDDAVTPLFRGLVVRLSFEVTEGVPRLAVECKDKAFRLTRPRRTAVYPETTDADAVGEILRRAGIASGDLGSGGGKRPALVQYDASDWDFIASRAEANGKVVVVTDGELSLRPLALSGAPVLSLQLGVDPIEELELELDAGDQHPDVEAVGWDLPKGAVTAAAAAAPLALAQGNTDPADAGRRLGLADAVLSHLVPLQGGELKAWASARLARSRLAMMRGRVTLAGTGDVALMDLLGLAGVGDRFNGNALVTAVRHVVESGGWRTDLRLGLPSEGFAQAPDILNVPANGLMPAARGLQIGVVAAYKDDEDGEYRLRVALPGVSSGDGTLWARLAAPEAGNGRGFFFRPDAGDEVVVGFLADDPRQPVVLGALFGSKNAPPKDFASVSEDNPGKGLRSKHGIELGFTDQEKPIVTLKTPAGAVTIDDDKCEVRLADGNKNTVVMNSDGVSIKSGKDFIIEASGKVKIKGTSVDVN